MTPRILVQQEDFSLADEYARLASRPETGAIVAFVGQVRDLSGADALELEHYSGMTEKSLAGIVGSARQRWPLQAVTVIHRIGRLGPAEQIVLVLTASAHRAAAYQANAFIMDYLKTEAPFWKREHGPDGAHWVDARETDEAARQRWEKS